LISARALNDSAVSLAQRKRGATPDKELESEENSGESGLGADQHGVGLLTDCYGLNSQDEREATSSMRGRTDRARLDPKRG
jgi:hypothetical protein